MAADDGVPCYRSLYPAEKIGRVWRKIGIVAAEDWQSGGRRLAEWRQKIDRVAAEDKQKIDRER